MDYRDVKPNAILLARQIRGLSQRELAVKLGVSQSILSRIEHGFIKPPSQEFVSKLSDILRYRESFFYKEKEMLNPISIVWRKKSSLEAKERDKIIGWAVERVYEIETLLRDLEVEVNAPRYELGVDFLTPEDVAKAVREYWKVPSGPIENMVALLERSGIMVIELNTSDRMVDGFTLRNNRALSIIFINKNQPADRMRFSLAHELGHLVMHGWTGSGEEEQEANDFASAFLLPEKDIRRQLTEMNWNNILHMKQYWKTSMAALVMRSSSLDIVSPSRKASIFQRFSRNGWRTKEPGEFEKEKPKLLRALIEKHKEELGFSSNELSEMMDLLPEEYLEGYEPDDLPISRKLIAFPTLKTD